MLCAEAKKLFFSEEKNQKTFFCYIAQLSGGTTPTFAKVFCFFSSEKKAFLSLQSVASPGASRAARSV
jgi:hypothetical protein